MRLRWLALVGEDSKPTWLATAQSQICWVQWVDRQLEHFEVQKTEAGYTEPRVQRG
jgi:hypothetical protein